mgnify:CR=1 FL=1
MTCAGSLAGGCALFGSLWLLGDMLGAALLTKIFVLPCSALVHTQTRGYIRRKYGIQVRPRGQSWAGVCAWWRDGAGENHGLACMCVCLAAGWGPVVRTQGRERAACLRLAWMTAWEPHECVRPVSPIVPCST